MCGNVQQRQMGCRVRVTEPFHQNQARHDHADTHSPHQVEEDRYDQDADHNHCFAARDLEPMRQPFVVYNADSDGAVQTGDRSIFQT